MVSIYTTGFNMKQDRQLLISNFRRVLNVVYFLLGNSAESEFNPYPANVENMVSS